MDEGRKNRMLGDVTQTNDRVANERTLHVSRGDVQETGQSRYVKARHELTGRVKTLAQTSIAQPLYWQRFTTFDWQMSCTGWAS